MASEIEAQRCWDHIKSSLARPLFPFSKWDLSTLDTDQVRHVILNAKKNDCEGRRKIRDLQQVLRKHWQSYAVLLPIMGHTELQVSAGVQKCLVGRDLIHVKWLQVTKLGGLSTVGDGISTNCLL